MRQAALFASLAFLPLGLGPESAQQSAGPGTMTFFVTSVGPGTEQTSAALRGQTGIANPWRRPRAPVTAPGVPT